MPMPDSPLKISFNLPFSEAIKSAQQRGVVLPDVYYGELQGLARQQTFSIAGVASLDQLTIVRDSLSATLQNGQTFKQWKKDILESGTLDLPNYRLDNIFRTNIQSNYNRGRWERFVETKATRPYLMYDAINDSRVRPTHLAMDNIIRPIDDPFWHTHAPLNGYRCRCRLISLSDAQAQARSGTDTKNQKYYGPEGEEIPQVQGGHGLNKVINEEEMKPDKGFDYNPGEDLLAGINQGIASRATTAPAKLVKALDEKLGKGQSALVSDSFKIQKSGLAKNAANIVLPEIDKLHGIDNLPSLPLKTSTSDRFQGAYSYYPNTGEAVDIKVSTASVNPALTLAHEIGHFIDHQALSVKGKYASTSSPLMQPWRDAIAASEATKTLKEVPGKLSAYYLSAHEQWARSYAQWVAIRSSNDIMLEQLKRITLANDAAYKASQWLDSDFEAIGQAIDELFKTKGWLNE